MEDTKKQYPLLNVKNADEVRSIAEDIINDAADVIVNTMGPYGKYTIIQLIDGLIKTKDGKRVFSQLNYSHNLMYNSILAHIETIATSVALKVGDGTSTATNAARYMYKNIKHLMNEYPNCNTRELEDTIHEVVKDICKCILNNATKVSEENIRDVMKRVALVSTNWNEELSEMLANIYERTSNPIIKVENSGTEYTTVDISDDTYTLNGKVMDTYHLTNRDSGEGVYSEPMMLFFDHNISDEYVQLLVYLYTGFITAASQTEEATIPEIIVLAPSFSDSFLHTLQSTFNMYKKSNRLVPKIIPVKIIAASNFDKMCIRDAAMLSSASIISYTDEIKSLIKSVKDISITHRNLNQSAETDEAQKAEFNAKVATLSMAILDQLAPMAGVCDSIKVDATHVEFNGFSMVNRDVYEGVVADCKAGIDSKLNSKDALAMITEDIRLRKIRLGKLLCKSGTIKVGGYGKAEVEATKDALDDAIKACEAVFHNGYTLGCSLSVPIACNKLIDRETDKDSLRLKLISAIAGSFKSVYHDIANNKRLFEDVEFDEIFSTCVVDETTFDLVTETYGKESGKEIINPVTTDTEVLKAAMRLTLLCLTSNQMITKDFGIIDPNQG